jgi:hypothetical protein
MKMTAIHKNKRLKCKKITDSAAGEDCALRITGICNFNPETVVFAHINGAGMALKAHDIHGCYACSDCHSWYDDKLSSGWTQWDQSEKDQEFLRAMIETQSKLIQKGLIKI